MTGPPDRIERLCSDCGSELERSKSERGRYWCPDCNDSRRSIEDIQIPCNCCHRHYIDDSALCKNCQEHGCSDLTSDCKYLQNTVDPEDCDHSMTPFPFEDVKRCTICGLERALDGEIGG